MLTILALIGFSGVIRAMSYQDLNGDLSEGEALAIALSDSEQEHQHKSAAKIQALYRGWFQRKRALSRKIQVYSYFRTVYPDGAYRTRRIPLDESLASFEGKVVPMAQLQHAKKLFIRSGMCPFAYAISVEKVKSGEKDIDEVEELP